MWRKESTCSTTSRIVCSVKLPPNCAGLERAAAGLVRVTGAPACAPPPPHRRRRSRRSLASPRLPRRSHRYPRSPVSLAARGRALPLSPPPVRLAPPSQRTSPPAAFPRWALKQDRQLAHTEQCSMLNKRSFSAHCGNRCFGLLCISDSFRTLHRDSDSWHDLNRLTD
jgi:hypothetical protein